MPTVLRVATNISGDSESYPAVAILIDFINRCRTSNIGNDLTLFGLRQVVDKPVGNIDQNYLVANLEGGSQISILQNIARLLDPYTCRIRASAGKQGCV